MAGGRMYEQPAWGWELGHWPSSRSNDLSELQSGTQRARCRATQCLGNGGTKPLSGAVLWCPSTSLWEEGQRWGDPGGSISWAQHWWDWRLLPVRLPVSMVGSLLMFSFPRVVTFLWGAPPGPTLLVTWGWGDTGNVLTVLFYVTVLDCSATEFLLLLLLDQSCPVAALFGLVCSYLCERCALEPPSPASCWCHPQNISVWLAVQGEGRRMYCLYNSLLSLSIAILPN